LTYAFTQKFDKASLRDRQLDLIAQYTIRIVHITGEQNTVANALFRMKNHAYLQQKLAEHSRHKIMYYTKFRYFVKPSKIHIS